MKLSQITLSDCYIPPEWDREIRHVRVDSRLIQQGDALLVRSIDAIESERFIADAIARGAVAVVAQGALGFACGDGGVPIFSSPAVADHWQSWLHRRYARVAQLSLIGVTGTNGKSSVTQYIAQLLMAMGHPCGLLGTLGNGLWPQLQATANTTSDLAITLQQLDGMVGQANWAALEVSSHGLQQQRIAGLAFKGAVFTNLSHDHLDYHQSMENYFAAKRRLFEEYAIEHALINVDDEYGRALAQSLPSEMSVLTYGCEAMADVQIHDICWLGDRLQARIRSPWGDDLIQVPLLGDFNMSNAVAAMVALAQQGMDWSALCIAAQQLQPVLGRMAFYRHADGRTAVIDFAHTPDALANALAALPTLSPYVVFGCGGDRDRRKRPLMAAALDGIEQVWLTDDNPRFEDPESIWQDVLQHAPAARFHRQHNRSLAIEEACAAMPANGVVLIAGKGHEAYQDVAGQRHAYSDESVLLALGFVRGAQTHVA